MAIDWETLLAYRPSDLLMFSPRTYWRLFERANTELWPAPLLTLAVGIALAVLLWRRGTARVHAVALAGLGAAWGVVAWVFFAERFAEVHTVGMACAAAFACQGALLLAAAAWPGARTAAAPPRPPMPALVLMLFALVVQPAIGVLSGRLWAQAEVFGIAPDPTVAATFALLAMRPGSVPRLLRAALWAVPLAWTAFAAMTLATMGEGQAVVLPLAAAAALAIGRRARRGPRAAAPAPRAG